MCDIWSKKLFVIIQKHEIAFFMIKNNWFVWNGKNFLSDSLLFVHFQFLVWSINVIVCFQYSVNTKHFLELSVIHTKKQFDDLDWHQNWSTMVTGHPTALHWSPMTLLCLFGVKYLAEIDSFFTSNLIWNHYT